MKKKMCAGFVLSLALGSLAVKADDVTRATYQELYKSYRPVRVDIKLPISKMTDAGILERHILGPELVRHVFAGYEADSHDLFPLYEATNYAPLSANPVFNISKIIPMT